MASVIFDRMAGTVWSFSTACQERGMPRPDPRRRGLGGRVQIPAIPVVMAAASTVVVSFERRTLLAAEA